MLIALNPLQAKGLLACASDGAEGLLTDAEAAKSYIGDEAAQAAAAQALGILKRAVHGRQKNEALLVLTAAQVNALLYAASNTLEEPANFERGTGHEYAEAPLRRAFEKLQLLAKQGG